MSSPFLLLFLFVVLSEIKNNVKRGHEVNFVYKTMRWLLKAHLGREKREYSWENLVPLHVLVSVFPCPE